MDDTFSIQAEAEHGIANLYQAPLSLTRGASPTRGGPDSRLANRGSSAMPIPLRLDYDAGRVRAAARASKNANQVRRLLALAAIYDGTSRAEAAEIGGLTRQIIRDW